MDSLHKAIWKKMSKFNFPLQEDSDYHGALNSYIDWLQCLYNKDQAKETTPWRSCFNAEEELWINRIAWTIVKENRKLLRKKLET